MTASYAKLKSGDWGIRVTGGNVSTGSTVTVTKKDGTTKTETVTQVVWSGNGVTLCAVAPSRQPARSGGYRPQAGRRTGCACGSYENEVNEGDCFSCRHDQE